MQEARERVRAAVRNSGFKFPGTRVVAALAPANLKKAGPAYDLPIAVATLIATGQAPPEADGLVLLGELGLDGTLRHTPGILPMVSASHEKGFSRIVVPEASAKEASLVDGVEILPFANLAQLAAYLRKEIPPLPVPPPNRRRRIHTAGNERHRFCLYQGAGACETGVGDCRRRWS